MPPIDIVHFMHKTSKQTPAIIDVDLHILQSIFSPVDNSRKPSFPDKKVQLRAISVWTLDRGYPTIKCLVTRTQVGVPGSYPSQLLFLTLPSPVLFIILAPSTKGDPS